MDTWITGTVGVGAGVGCAGADDNTGTEQASAAADGMVVSDRPAPLMSSDGVLEKTARSSVQYAGKGSAVGTTDEKQGPGVGTASEAGS